MQIASAMGGSPLVKRTWCAVPWARKKESVLKAQRESFIQGSVNNGIQGVHCEMKYLTCSYTLLAMALINHIVRLMRTLRTKQRILKATISLNSWLLPWRALCRTCKSWRTTSMPARSIMLRYSGPDINYSERSFAVQDDAIRFRPWGIKNVGDNAIDRLIREHQWARPIYGYRGFLQTGR